jgi:mycothiol synthase
VLVVEVAGRVVGWGMVSVREEGTGARLFINHTLLVPEWRGRGLMHAMQRWMEDRAARMDAASPTEAPRLLSVWAADAQLARLAVLRDFGYLPVRWAFEMERDLAEPIPDLSPPPGIVVRPPRPDEHRKVFMGLVEADRDEWGQFQVHEEDFERFMGTPTTDPSLWSVAWDGDRVVGTVLGWIDHAENEQTGRLVGYTEDIAVLPAYRRRGIARALLAHNMALMRNRGMKFANLGVDTENPSGALRLYEGLGFRAVRRHGVYRKPLGA